MTKVFKIKAHQILANYRVPLTHTVRDSYPLPPLSTVKGWFHSIINAKEFIPVSMSIQGKSSSIDYDIQTLHKHIEEVVTKTPCNVALVNDIYLTIYLHAEKQYLDQFEDMLFDKFSSLGRRSDHLKIDYAGFVDLEEKSFTRDDNHIINYGIYLNKETADKALIRGINYKMCYKYQTDKGLRYFIGDDGKYDVVFVDEAVILRNSYLYDKKDNRIVDLIGAYQPVKHCEVAF